VGIVSLFVLAVFQLLKEVGVFLPERLEGYSFFYGEELVFFLRQGLVGGGVVLLSDESSVSAASMCAMPAAKTATGHKRATRLSSNAQTGSRAEPIGAFESGLVRALVIVLRQVRLLLTGGPAALVLVEHDLVLLEVMGRILCPYVSRAL
tara:strand:- start:3018 stop:3467 length:450 start_codon:yes stop_codon:yes gene_type:complete